jgi:predicted DsbA family dithiol-disulfide isomerase
MKENKNNPLMCNPESGVCEIPLINEAANSKFETKQEKPVKVIYFTDPICSSCWGIEPQLRKLKLEYGNSIEIEYHMGGLLPDWSYNSGGISKPSDVAHHWDEVSQYYDMPIDGDVWLEDPLSSSYPPSIAFKAAQMQDELKAINFLRRIREMLFIEKKNITKWEHLSLAASQTGLDVIKLKTDYETTAKALFESDLALAKKLGVRGFPTLFFIDSNNNQQTLYGYNPYQKFEEAVLTSFPKAIKAEYNKSWTGLFYKYPSLTRREFSELSGLSKAESGALLDQLTNEGILIKTSTKNGSLWTIKKSK